MANGALLNTSSPGSHTFAVNAISLDGQQVKYTIPYTVLPDNHFTVVRIAAHPNGSTDLNIRVPGNGAVNVMETAWIDNLAVTASLLPPGPRRFVIARSHANAPRAGNLRIHVTLNRLGKLLLLHHTYRPVFRLWVSYTPTGGRQRNIGISGLHFTR